MPQRNAPARTRAIVGSALSIVDVSTLTQLVRCWFAHAPFVYVPAVSRGAFLGMALNKMSSDLGATANDMRDFQSAVTARGGVLQLV